MSGEGGVTVRLGIVCAATQTMGHAAVARALAEQALLEVKDLQRLVILSDQTELLARLSFMPAGVELLALGKEAIPPLDLLFVDAIPFRRTDVVELLKTLPNPRPEVIVGHTGWVIDPSIEQGKGTAERLRAMGASRIVLYHPSAVCNGACHVGALSEILGLTISHTGLLLPRDLPLAAPKANTFMMVAGGGGGASLANAYADAQSRLVELARTILRKWPTWECDFIAGPYAKAREAEPRLRVLTGVTDVGRRLRGYQFSLTLGGYSATCEHIAAGVPTIIQPVEHAEQIANSVWARPHLRSVDLTAPEGIRFGPTPAPPPATFEWRQVLA